MRILVQILQYSFSADSSNASKEYSFSRSPFLAAPTQAHAEAPSMVFVATPAVNTCSAVPNFSMTALKNRCDFFFKFALFICSSPGKSDLKSSLLLAEPAVMALCAAKTQGRVSAEQFMYTTLCYREQKRKKSTHVLR